jgi:Domain of unknown function (DUF5916)
VRKLTCILTALLLLYLTSAAQTGLNTQPAVSIKKTTGTIKIDGVLNEMDWQAAVPARNFVQNFPTDTALAVSQTEASVCFGSEYLYISAICYQPNKYTIRTLKRDFESAGTDVFSVNIDPFGDKLNGFYFAVSPYGIQKEGQIFNGNSLNIDWDNKWQCAVKRLSDRWIVEMAIPFKSLRYKVLEGQNTWFINFLRNNATQNERSSWIPISRNLLMTDINFTGKVLWPEPPPKIGANAALIPYTLLETNQNFLGMNPKGVQTKLNAGLDAKIAVTPALNLDLTLNPDFAQVEVDKQVTDLSRFELFFPERRQFFIENSDLFGGFGSAFNEVTPFFSRRIGLSEDASGTGNTAKIPIIAGARLSGRINKDWRIGLLSTQTAAVNADSLPSANFFVAAIQRRVLKRSNLAALFVNKSGLVDEKTGKMYNRFNRVAGLEFNYSSESAVWVGKAFAHQSFQPKKSGNQGTAGLELGYITGKWLISPALYYIGKNFNAEVGYVPRTGIIQHPMTVNRFFYPKGNAGKKINYISLGPDYNVVYDNFIKKITDWESGLYGKMLFQNSAEISVALVRWDYTRLFNDFDPTNKYAPGFNVLKEGTAYQYFSNRFGYKTDSRKMFTLDVKIRFGSYFNGNIRTVQSTVAYRWQPFGIFSADANYTRIRLPEGFNKADFWIIGAKSEITFTKNLFWTTYAQYNNQLNNFNINSRLQWRFKPLSDFFLVYTDNYFAQDDKTNSIIAFGKKNKAIVLKLNYWLNL